MATGTTGCPATCLGGAGNIRSKMCTSSKCCSCALLLFEKNCDSAKPEVCTKNDSEQEEEPTGGAAISAVGASMHFRHKNAKYGTDELSPAQEAAFQHLIDKATSNGMLTEADEPQQVTEEAKEETKDETKPEPKKAHSEADSFDQYWEALQHARTLRGKDKVRPANQMQADLMTTAKKQDQRFHHHQQEYIKDPAPGQFTERQLKEFAEEGEEVKVGPDGGVIFTPLGSVAEEEEGNIDKEEEERARTRAARKLKEEDYARARVTSYMKNLAKSENDAAKQRKREMEVQKAMGLDPSQQAAYKAWHQE